MSSGAVPAETDSLTINVSMCDGASAEFRLNREDTVMELLRSVAQEFALVVASLVLQSEEPALSIDIASSQVTLEVAGLVNHSALTAINMAHIRLAAFPEKFTLLVSSMRRALGRQTSSRLIAFYRLGFDASEERLVLEQWRKSDHDTAELDFRRKTMGRMTSHWMSGSETHVSNLSQGSLQEHCLDIMTKAVPLDDTDCRFWRPEDRTPDCNNPVDADRDGGMPLPERGWFVLPDEVATELKLGMSLIHVGMTGLVERILVNAQGIPIRMAIDIRNHRGRDEPMIEEYVVEIRHGDSRIPNRWGF
eukprot:TRINITY_DN11822_c0_g1_i3.p1 TRINITY_DN11822_c0_g1~~TRINITY_DN11822_c0_g1_i3.p1  ORF type:complete len:306 (+),score=25.11 TRINITY_DN11822_c0_g1_i3:70-987(+)